MDRRRFVPTSEALDRRTLLSTTGLFGQSNAAGSNSPQGSHPPDTFNEKLLRIQRIPSYLEKLQPGRFLSPTTMQSLQVDITDVAADLHVAPPPVLRAFNLQIRKMMPKVSLSPADVAKINNLFGVVLESEGATPQQVNNLKNDMLALAKADAASPNPVFLATNDYSILVQAVSIIGHPIESAAKPLLAQGSGERLKTPGFGATSNPTPTFVGNYRPNAQVDPGTRIQILDLQGNVLGSGAVMLSGSNQGRYHFSLDQPLKPGVNWLRVRAIDAEGHTSIPSSVFAIKLVGSGTA